MFTAKVVNNKTKEKFVLCQASPQIRYWTTGFDTKLKYRRSRNGAIAFRQAVGKIENND